MVKQWSSILRNRNKVAVFLTPLVVMLALSCQNDADIQQAVELAVVATRIAEPTATPYPTFTPAATHTPYPTYTPHPPPPTPPPLPTHTPYPQLPTNTPYPTFTPYPTLAPAPTALPPAISTPLPTYTPYPTTTPYPTPQANAWKVIPGGDTLGLVTTNTGFSSTGTYKPRVWTLRVECTDDKEFRWVELHKHGGDFSSDDSDDFIDIPIGVSIDDLPFLIEEWWLYAPSAGINAFISQQADKTITTFMIATTFEVKIAFQDGESDQIRFAVNGLSDFIEKPADLCE